MTPSLSDILRQRISDRMARRTTLSNAIAESRQNVDPNLVEMRSTPRLSLEELEQLSDTEIGSRLKARGPEDTRSGVTRFFDILDLPRNVIANIVLRPFVDRETIRNAQSGTFGIPRINFSDALDQMGLDPGIARSVLGFIGDVVLDPLTYVGGTSTRAGALIGLKSGSVGVKRGTSKVADKTISTVTSGKEVFDPTKMSKKLSGLEDVLGRTMRPSVIEAMKKGRAKNLRIDASAVRTPVEQLGREKIVREAIFGRTINPLDRVLEGAVVPEVRRAMSADDIFNKIISGEAFTKAELEAGGRKLQSILDYAKGKTGSAAASVKVMITKADEAALKGLGYTDDQIRKMKPAEAGAILEKATALKGAAKGAVRRKVNAAFKDPLDVIDSPRVGPPGSIFVDRQTLVDRVMSGSFTPDQMTDKRIRALIRRKSKIENHVYQSLNGGPRKLTPGEVADKIKQSLPRLYPASKNGKFKIPFSPNETRAMTGFQPGRIARGIGDDAGIQSFIAREGRTRGIEMRVPFTDIGVRLKDMDPRMIALRHGDASKFAAEIGDIGTAYRQTMLQGVSKAIRGAEAEADALNPSFRTATANAILSFDRKMQGYFGFGSRESEFGHIQRQASNQQVAAKAAAQSLAIGLKNEIGKITAGMTDEAAKTVNDTIVAKLEIGLAAAKDPDGVGGFVGASGLDEAILSSTADNAGAVANKIRDAKDALIAQGRGSEWDEILDVVADGLESGAWHNPMVNRFVDKNRMLYQSIDESAVKNSFYEEGIESYFGRIASDDATTAIQQNLRGNVTKYRTAQERRVMLDQGFVKHRTTNRLVWKDSTGQVHSHYLFELSDPAVAAKVQDAKVKGFLKDGEEYQSSIFHVNSLTSKDPQLGPRPLDALTGATFRGELFDTNPAVALASSYRQLQRAKIGRDFSEYAAKHARAVTKDMVNKLEGSKMIEPIKGQNAWRVVAENLTDDSGRVIGNRGDIIRQLNIKSDHPIFKNLGDEKVMFFDDRVATKIEDFATHFDDPSKIAEFLHMTDQVVRHMRGLTLAHPSWLMQNIGSNTVSVALMGGSAKHIPLFKKASSLYGRYHTILRAGGEGMKEFLDETTEIGGRLFTNREIIRTAEATGVLEQGRILREMVNVLGNTTETMWQKATKIPEEHVLASVPGGSPARAAGRLGRVAKHIYTKGLANWFLMNHSIEQRQRLWGMMVRLSKGDNPIQAGTNTIRHMFDYGDLTRFENEFMRKLVFFYPWVRNNTPFMITKLFEDPKWAAAFPKLKVAIEDAIDEEDRIPESMRPSWFKNQLGVQAGKQTGILLPMMTQFQDLAEFGQLVGGRREDVKEFLLYMTSQLNPLYQLPFELAQGREFYTGREIGDPDLGQIGVGEFLKSQVRPFREAERMSRTLNDPTLTTGGKVGGLVTRGLVGGRIQTLSREKGAVGNIIELSDTAAKLRNEINRSVREGDRQRAIRLTIRLEDVWRRMLEIDPETKRVPQSVKDRILAPTDQAGTVPAA